MVSRMGRSANEISDILLRASERVEVSKNYTTWNDKKTSESFGLGVENRRILTGVNKLHNFSVKNRFSGYRCLNSGLI